MSTLIYKFTMHTTWLVLAFSLVVFAALKTKHFFTELTTFSLSDFVDAVAVMGMMMVGVLMFYGWFVWFRNFLRRRRKQLAQT